ncbi:MAG: hypothetical protein HKN58_07575 [Xanthomonadales bacterium]|nr:hypothetical protein [Xanthomonadales bacterium]
MNTHDKDNWPDDLEALQRRYRSEATEEPPELLDQAVLNRARREVERRATRPWNFGWMHATASVALVVLGLALILELRESAELAKDHGAAIEARDPRADAQSVRETDAGAEATFRQRKAEQMEAEQEIQKSVLLRELREDAVRPTAPSAAGAPPVVIVRPAPPLQQNEPDDPASAALGDSAATPARGQRQERTASAAAPLEAEASPDEWETDGDLLVFSSAAEWLDYIIGLRQVGEEDAWRSELDAFRQAFPDYPVPEALTRPDANGDEATAGDG